MFQNFELLNVRIFNMNFEFKNEINERIFSFNYLYSI